MTRQKDTNYKTSYIDIAGEIKNMRELGFQWCGYRRVDYTRPCSCNTEEGKGCIRCFQTSYLFTDFLVKAHFWTSFPGVEFSSPASLVSTQSKYALLEWNQPVQKFGFILELDLEAATGKVRQPFSILRVYEIQNYEIIRGESAKIEYNKCFIEERNFDDKRSSSYSTGNLYKGNRSTPDII